MSGIRRAASGLLLGSVLWVGSGDVARSQEPGGVEPAGWSHSMGTASVVSDAHCLPGEAAGMWSAEADVPWWQWWRRGHHDHAQATLIKRQTDYYRRQRHHPNFIHPVYSPHHAATWGYHLTCWRRFPEEYLAPCPCGSCRDLLQPGYGPGELVPAEAVPAGPVPGAGDAPGRLPMPPADPPNGDDPGTAPPPPDLPPMSSRLPLSSPVGLR
ncbi:hypothetical protein Mal4_03380 [Maioricimonas rarisocia]|uniref:Uncharacterized protein n=1 Tax=Maioricimonas rarisocia TaxID=2528026 RepID=A0A517Z0S1_9PLAN|nr:hypothetical protein [Maioricimonas rarisocia]QDU36055.1 hypothetical protein Mal4_03380 [Maioricimonas rarisocia]